MVVKHTHVADGARCARFSNLIARSNTFSLCCVVLLSCRVYTKHGSYDHKGCVPYSLHRCASPSYDGNRPHVHCRETVPISESKP